MHQALSDVAAHIFSEKGYKRFVKDLKRNDPVTMKWALLRHLYVLYFSGSMDDPEASVCFGLLDESPQELKALRTRCTYFEPDSEYCN